MDYLGYDLRKRRIQAGRTQQWMADRLSIHRTTYTKYERGQVEPSLATLCRLADVLDCTTDDLLGRK